MKQIIFAVIASILIIAILGCQQKAQKTDASEIDANGQKNGEKNISKEINEDFNDNLDGALKELEEIESI
ncbi:hypothetical protein HYX01_00700 [Candidatus Woesearchaeota archaeon]|nr:hypothetical protein [Candidatus Woesearchaeota archaeon]